jgi:formylglycine-generating enzyme required for sulfatase activity
MGGNVAEWTSDSSAALDSPCWSGDGRILVNPRCTAERAALGSLPMARGGAWDSPANDARVSRRHVNVRVRRQSVGVRCAASLGD